MSVWADNISNIFPASVSSLKLRFFGATIDDAYYTLPYLTEATAKLSAYVEDDNYKRPGIAYGHTLQIMATTMATPSSYLIRKLQDMKRVHVKAVLDSGNTISTGLIASHSLDTAMGVHWEYSNTDSPDKPQKITFTFEMAVTNAEALLMVNGTPPADGTPDAGDIAYGLLALPIHYSRGCGITLVELAATGGAYTDIFSTVEGTSFTARSVSDRTDHRNRATPISVDVTVSAELEQAGTSEVDNALVINQRRNDLRITLMNLNPATSAKMIVTLGANVGCTFDPIRSEGGTEKKAVIPLTARGNMTLANWTACWPGDIIA